MIQVPPQLRPQFGAPPHHPQYVPNGQVPGAPPQPVQLPPQQKIIEKSGVRILCIADVRGNLRSLNELAKKANADHIIHTGDFGFYDNSSLERIADKTLRHVAQYSPLLDERLKKSIQSPGASHVPIKQLVGAEPNPLSELPLFLSGTYTLDVPVYTVWGACEDVRVLEKFRSNEYRINNLHIIDEASSRLLDVGGVKLRLLGLGGAVVMHKLFDIGEGKTTIAGGQGTMWTTLLQMGDLVDTANRVYDAAETRIFITHASPAREGLLNQLSVTLKADFSISAGLHFRYGSSYNEFSVNPSLDHYRGKLASSKASFNDVWETVKNEVLAAVQQNTAQNKLLENALAIVDKMPTSSNGGSPFGGPPANAAPGAGQVDESAFKNMWNFNLADAAFGWLVLEVENGRIGTEMRAQGFNFHHRGGKPQLPTQQQQQQPKPTMAPTTSAAPPSTDSGPVNVSVPSIPTTNNANAPISPAVPPVGPRKQTQNQGVQQPAVPPPVPKQPTPPPPQEESLVVKPATPRPAPSGPAADRVPTPSVAPVAPLPTAVPAATPAATPTAEKTPTSNGTSPASVPPALPKVDTPAASAQNTAPTSSQSPLEKTKQTGLYISGVLTETEARQTFPPEDECRILRVEEKTSRTRNLFKFYLVYFESMEVTKEILDKLPEDLKSGPPGQRNGKPYVKMMQDEFTPGDRISSGNRPGMNDSRWGRGPAVGGNTSESDNNMGGGYRGRGNFGGRGKSRGGYEGTRVSRGRGKRGFHSGDGGSSATTPAE
ncbi:uncharacterized protein H6S33_000479 [Morchella sextelata]|uniref:uncharacterized protein n=1 Tax=Morchella sextelata TaxID=1174677 RepID=UPI001D04F572|nr:uncharacterized protein H6S33_000479 [Morchella sextelata]KAH0614843.1 hypothetical protein H6S33_000479 [Morchella sextelata]